MRRLPRPDRWSRAARHERARHPRGAFRRTRWTATIVFIVLGGLMFGGAGQGSAAPAARQQAGLPPGAGTGTATTYKVNPTASQLSIGITFGLSLAGFQNTVAGADSRAIDLGVIGTSAGAPGCDGGDPSLPKEDQPQPLTVSSSDEGAADGRTSTEQPGITQQVRATPDPFAVAITESAPQSIGALVHVGGGRAEVRSGIIGGNLRETTSISDVSGITIGPRVASGTSRPRPSLLPGLGDLPVPAPEVSVVELRGLHWEATQRTGADNSFAGRFTINEATIGGQPIPTNDPAATIAQVNNALVPLGFTLSPPTFRESEGNVFVDPLKIGFVPSNVRDPLLRPVITAAQPAREAIFGALLEADCSNATAITVADITLGGITGAGSFTLELGGVSATTSELSLSSQLGALGQGGLGATPLPGFNSSPGSAGSESSSGGTSGTAGRPATPSRAAPAPAASGGDEAANVATSTPVDPVADFVGERGGLLAAIAGGSLLLLAAVAEGDRRKMRRAQREIPFLEA